LTVHAALPPCCALWIDLQAGTNSGHDQDQFPVLFGKYFPGNAALQAEKGETPVNQLSFALSRCNRSCIAFLRS
jgi:hypothetical protein